MSSHLRPGQKIVDVRIEADCYIVVTSDGCLVRVALSDKSIKDGVLDEIAVEKQRLVGATVHSLMIDSSTKLCRLEYDFLEESFGDWRRRFIEFNYVDSFQVALPD